VEDII